MTAMFGVPFELVATVERFGSGWYSNHRPTLLPGNIGCGWGGSADLSQAGGVVGLCHISGGGVGLCHVHGGSDVGLCHVVGSWKVFGHDD